MLARSRNAHLYDYWSPQQLMTCQLQSAGILREARGEFVILFGFQAKLVKIVKQNRTEFFSQIKKITDSENDRI